jgi:hypothetical protein
VVYISVVEKDVIRALYEARGSGLKHLGTANTQILTKWRTNRYEREALPDSFNDAFVTGYLNNEGSDLRDYFQARRELITDIYVYIYEYTEEGESKLLISFTLLMDYNKGSDEIDAAKDVLRHHLIYIEQNYPNLSCLQVAPEYVSIVEKEILPTLDLAIEPEDFSLEDVYLMYRLNLDYVCWDG